MLRLLAERLPVGKKDFSAAHYRALEMLAQTGGTLSLPGGAAAVCRQGTLTLAVPAVISPEETPLRPGDNRVGTWHIRLSDTPAPGALAVRPGAWSVRPWRREDGLTLPGSRGRRSLKRLLAERGVPPEQRDAVPVFCLAGQAAAVPGVGVDASAVPEQPGNTIYIQLF